MKGANTLHNFRQDRQELLESLAADGSAFHGPVIKDYVVCSFDDPQKDVDTLMVQRFFTPESAEILTDLAERAQIPFPTYRLLYKNGHGVSLFDLQDAKYVFVHSGKSAASVRSRVERAVDRMPLQLTSGLGRGILLGASRKAERRMRFVGLSLDTETQERLKAERATIMRAMGIRLAGDNSPHVSLLRTRQPYEAAQQAVNYLDELARPLDRYIAASQDPTLKLVLGKPEIALGGLQLRTVTQ